MNRIKQCRHGMMIYPQNDIYIGRSLDLYGEFSEAEVRLFQTIIKSGDVVLDIGAHIGAHTVPLARSVGRSGKVIAMEPQRLGFYCLCANVAMNDLSQVICYQVAAGAKSGVIQVPELDWNAQQNFGAVELERQYAGSTYTVSLVRIDDLHLKRCNLIKIDVEGMEQEVLKGAADTIRTHQPILYVEDDRKEKSANLRTLLREFGYDLFAHLPPFFNKNNFASNPDNVFGTLVSANLLCWPLSKLKEAVFQQPDNVLMQVL